jgi:hypothetical protein
VAEVARSPNALVIRIVQLGTSRFNSGEVFLNVVFFVSGPKRPYASVLCLSYNSEGTFILLMKKELAMSQANQDQVPDILGNGLANFANAVGDRELVQYGAMVFRSVKEVFFEHIKAGDTCTFAFPSLVVLPDIRVDCFVAILTDGL